MLCLQYAAQMLSGKPCTLESLEHFSFDEYLRWRLEGLPSPEDIQEMGGIFRRILDVGYMDVLERDNGDDATALERCHSQGWIQSDMVVQSDMMNPSPNAIRYSFPSPFHRSYVLWYLHPTTLGFQLVADVIS